jgi:hypothetical protein
MLTFLPYETNFEPFVPAEEFLPMKATISLLLALALAGAATAQDLVGDRPDFTESALTVAPGSWQLEAGATLTNTDLVETTGLGEVLLRHGLKPGTELRLEIPTYIAVSLDTEGVADPSGFGNAGLGLKQVVADGAGSGPRMAVLGHVALPTGSEDVVGADTAFDLVLAAEWDLSSRLALGMNVGGEVVFADDTETQQWLSASLGIGVTERLGAFVEGFTFTDELDDFETALDAGVTYLVNADLQLDARVGTGTGEISDEVFYGVGLVTRF